MPSKPSPKIQSKPDWLLILQSIKHKNNGQEPLYSQISTKLKEAIQTGEIPAKTKLPTNRELATLLEVDRSTIARAYGELSKSGFIESHVGRGTYAIKPEPGKSVLEKSTIDWSHRFSKASKTVFEIFQAESTGYEWKEDIISFAGGIPSFDNYPTENFELVLNSILSENRAENLFEYSPAEGHPALRKQVLKHLSETDNPAREEELLIVSGSQQGIDIVSSVLLDPGDHVVLEDPTYLWATCSFKSRQAECLPVPLDEEGLRLDVLSSHLSRFRPKLIYVIPNFQNPTGLTMSLRRRVELLKLANLHKVPILEDDFVGDLRYEGERIPSLRALDGSKNAVIHQGTFSKALCPALRLGWLVAPEAVLGRLLLAKRASNLSTNSISQIILAEFLEKGLLEKHLTTVRAIYKRRRDSMLSELEKEMSNLKDNSGNKVPVSWSHPDGGMFIWLKLPQGYSSRELMRYAREKNVSFAPGHLCFNSPQNTQFLRLCFIQNDVETNRAGIARLADSISAYTKEIFERKQSQSIHAFSSGGHNFI